MADPMLLRLVRRTGSELARRADAACLERALRAAGVPNASKIATYTTPHELAMLYRLARMCPLGTVALEIGSYLGASTCYIAAALYQTGGTLYCVDTWQNQTMPDGERDTLAEFKRNTKGIQDVLRLIQKPSQELTPQDVPAKLDFVFIDGDHSYSSVRSDFERVAPWLQEDVIVAMHDHAAYRGVARLIGELIVSEAWTVAALVDNLLCLKRAKFSA